jgi:hypothetical protein
MIKQSSSNHSVYSFGWFHAYQQLYKVLELRVGQLKMDSYIKLLTLFAIRSHNFLNI